MDQSTHHPPPRSVVHHEHVVSLRDEVLRNQRYGPIARGRGLLVHDLLDDPSIREDNCGPWAQLETVHAAILLCPFCKSVLMVSVWHTCMGG